MSKVGYRQGDVVLIQQERDVVRTSYLKGQKPDKLGRLVLAEGEVTGHAHVMNPKVAELLNDDRLPSGHSLLVVQEATVQRGDFIEGKVLETMPGGTIRFQQTDRTIIRFHPDDITIQKGGVKVHRAYAPLSHDEHDTIPVSPGTYRVIQQQTAITPQRRISVAD